MNIMWPLRTFHDYLDTTHETMHDTQGLRNSHPSFILSQSIQSLENILYLALPQQHSCEFHGGTLSDGQCTVHVEAHSLSCPCLICFNARARTESSLTIIFITMSVIIGVGGIII